MSRQAQLGLFAVAALLLLFGIFYVITDFGTRHSGYRIGVHFTSAAGLPTGAQVFFSGVTVGTVDQVQLLPDNSVDVILAIQNNINIPKNSKFLIQAPLTGSPSMIILPSVPHLPKGDTATPLPEYAVLPRRVLPIDEQPVGAASPTVGDLLQQGQGEVRRLDSMLATLEEREPKLLNTLQSALTNVDNMTTQLSGTVTGLSATLSSTLDQTGGNLVHMTGTLNAAVDRNQYKIDALLSSLDSTAVALNKSMDQLQGLASDPRLKTNLITTTTNIRELTGNIAGLTGDLRTITSDPNTQDHLRDALANLDATMQKANSLLGELGGTSHVYGIDAGATPYPSVSPGATMPPGTQTAPPANTKAELPAKQALRRVFTNLAQLQLRLSYYSAPSVETTNPALPSTRGPLGDINLLFLPAGGTSLMIGANDIGSGTTANALLMKNFHNGFHAGGGVIYSQLGLRALYDGGKIGGELRAYNLSLPTFDLYGNFDISRWGMLYLGERDITHKDRRTVFGTQIKF
jgi:phospholipid/cholesterol/gamma-HCH transport system substrate-binding protein